MGDDERTKVLVAECPMSWCGHTATVVDPETEYDAALQVEDHVNEEHSAMDLETLDEFDDVEVY